MSVNTFNKEINRRISEVAELGKYLWQKGWAERNAGNISVNIQEYMTDELREKLLPTATSVLPLDRAYPSLAGFFFLVTGTGKRMRDLALDPEHNSLMIRVTDAGDGYQMFSLGELVLNIHPTSELPTHLAIHEYLVLKGAKEKTVVHTHPNELISITQIRKFCNEEALNHLLWGMHPETMVIVPDGAGFLPYMLPGSQDIADATLKKFAFHKVIIWEKHGSFAIGRDVFEAFDLIDTLAKSAQIYFQCKSAGFEPEGLSQEKIAELKELSAKFLA
ncbi:MAG: rhamnulose-1-phosphate aldolase [Bacteroidales bacterium]|nr:rhamnulose-1-phosphate aldolase [Bacteroidales bacterium]